jgi:hypothetical protein
MTTALEGGEGSALRPSRSSPPGKTRYPLYRRLYGPQGRSGHVRIILLPPTEFDPRTVQSVASRYTNYTTRPTLCPKLITTLLCQITYSYIYILHIWRWYILMFIYITFHLCLILHENISLKLKHLGNCIQCLNKYLSVYCKWVYLESNE